MPKDLVDSFRAGDELTADLVDAILRELKRLRKMTAAPPLGISNTDGMTPPVLYLLDEDKIVPFQAPAGGVAVGSIASPTTFTATLLMNGSSSGTFTATSAPTTGLGRHFMNVAISASANGWAVWYNGYLWPITWDSC